MMPEIDDWDPRIQATARIGIQAKYWEKFPVAIEDNTFYLSKFYLLGTLVLHLNEDGSCYVRVKPIQPIHRSLHAFSSPQYSSYIIIVNYGGDSDFYGNWRCSIFPMEVRGEKKSKHYVTDAELGIQPDLVEKVWENWKEISNVYSEIYYKSAKLAYDKLPNNIAKLFQFDRIATTGKYFSPVVLAVELMRIGLEESQIDEIIQAIDHQAIEVMENDPRLLIAARNHATDLNKMYQIARLHCNEIYPYH